MSDIDNNQPQPVWAIVEIMGHDRTAGKFSRDGSLIRIDVPDMRPGASPDKYLTEMIGEGAIFRIRFVDEAAARFVAKSLQPQPIGVWELRQEIKRLAAPTVIEQEPEDDLIGVGDDDPIDRYEDEDEDEDELDRIPF